MDGLSRPGLSTHQAIDELANGYLPSIGLRSTVLATTFPMSIPEGILGAIYRHYRSRQPHPGGSSWCRPGSASPEIRRAGRNPVEWRAARIFDRVIALNKKSNARVWATIAISASAIGLTVAGIALGTAHTSVNYVVLDSWAQSVQGAATVLAVVVALYSSFADRRRLRELTADERNREATRVFAWLVPTTAQSGRRYWFLRFENEIGVPVYEWHLALGADHVCSGRLGPLRPGSSELSMPDLKDMTHAQAPRPVLSFVDSFSRSWVRDPHGRLARVDAIQECECADTTAVTLSESATLWTR